MYKRLIDDVIFIAIGEETQRKLSLQLKHYKIASETMELKSSPNRSILNSQINKLKVWMFSTNTFRNHHSNSSRVVM